jgi:hypothetical protein
MMITVASLFLGQTNVRRSRTERTESDAEAADPHAGGVPQVHRDFVFI